MGFHLSCVDMESDLPIRGNPDQMKTELTASLLRTDERLE